MKQSNLLSDAFSPLLTTSLRTPPLHEGLITRSILMDKLGQAIHYPLTMISAPAGFGKTILLNQWISGGMNEHLRNRVAWVSLESGCDLRRFWAYLLTALGEIQSGMGTSALALLESSQPPIHTILRILINEITGVGDDFVLILDDYHHVDDPTIHAALTFFINHLPPNLHLVVASRSQPPLSLARWRASNQLYELREDDLRFTPVEVATFFNDTKGLNLSTDDIAALGTRTEGWIAGLQLVALSIQGFDDLSRHRFVSAFTGSQRYIIDYLTEEVLQQQPESIKTFLLRTSVLDHLCASLCNAVTGQTDGQAMLAHLERTHVFIIPLDQEQNWYRYHHLFKDVLYHQLTQIEPGSIFELHRRAAEWYSNAGRTDEAIRHAFAAHEWDQAVELIEPAISTAWNRGEVRKIIEWLGRLPGEYLDSHPHLSQYYIKALLHGGQLEAAEGRLRNAEAVLRASLAADSSVGDRLLLGATCAFRTLVAAVSDEPMSALALGHEALSLLPSENMDVRSYVLNSLGVAHYYLGDMAEAVRALAEGGELARKAETLFPMLAAMAYQAEALMCQGQLRQAEQILQQALSRGEIPNQPIQSWIPAASYVFVGLGNLLYEWDRLEEAERYLTEAIELGQQIAFGSAPWSSYHTLLRVNLAHGDQKGALAMFKQAQVYQHAHSLPIPARLMKARQARAWLALGQLNDAERWTRTFNVARPPSPGFVEEFENITLARFHLLKDQQGRALDLLNQIYPIANSNGHQGHVIEILVLTALAQHAQGEAQLAIDTLFAALRMAEPEGYIRTFVDEGRPMAALLYQALAQGIMPDYVSRLLAAFTADNQISDSSLENEASARDRPTNRPLIEPLSPRELEVLQLIARGASNQDIAEELIIAITTAKKHVSNIIQKLGVENRTQAAAKGRNLGLYE